MQSQLPSGLVIGPMKTGTTWVYEYLRQRGDVCLPKGTKETFFFDRRYHCGLDWYKAHFRHCGQGMVIEVAPSYFNHSDAPQRIAATLDKPRLLAILRNPVERAFSHYLHLRRYGRTTLNIFDSCEIFPEIVGASRYATVLKKWYGQFGEEGVKVVLFETLTADPSLFVSQVCGALGIVDLPVPPSGIKKTNERAACINPELAALTRKAADRFRDYRLYPVIEFLKKAGLKKLIFGRQPAGAVKLSMEEEGWLYRQLEEEICELQTMLNLDLSFWRRD